MLLNRSRAEKIMRERELDALVASSPANVMYCSDYECVPHWVNTGIETFAVYSPDRNPDATLVAPAFALEPIAEGHVWIKDVYATGHYWRGHPDVDQRDNVEVAVRELLKSAIPMDTAIGALAHALRKRGLERGRIGIDEIGITISQWENLKSVLPNAKLVPASTTWWDIRAVKSGNEVSLLRAAASSAEKSIESALALVRPGIRESEIVEAYLAALAQRGAKPTMIFFSSGPRTSHPICLASNRVLQADDVIRYDVGCTFRYYHADTARALVLGSPKKSHLKIWDALVQGVDNAIALIRPGIEPGALFEAAMKPGRELGLHNFKRTNVGHGVGLTLPDPPFLRPSTPASAGNATGIEAGMVFTVEVGYHLPGEAGFLFEEIVHVTEHGCERLTAASRELRAF
jgi:Xaa-Pro aminopeptidase